MNTREDLRNFFLNFRETINKEDLIVKSKKIKKNFFRLKELNNCKNIMTYVSIDNEVLTMGIIKRLLTKDKHIFIPYIMPEKNKMEIKQIINPDRDIIPGANKIPEPVESLLKADFLPDIIDFVIVPGIVFSKSGYRIGYGYGYYEKFFSLIKKDIIKVALVFESLLVDNIPIEKNDIPVDIIISEERIIRNGSL